MPRIDRDGVGIYYKVHGVGADDTPFLAASDYMAAKIPGAQKS